MPILAVLFETICLYIEPFSNTLTFSGEHDPGTAKPFYPKSSLNLITTLKKFLTQADIDQCLEKF